ncbi:putative F-box protein CPR30 [Forsythia ovata]|uniref:F-box protein CPR30 n=1 Tax=Forsythia ovata TaxID=205694 RepID=A0ABD1QAS9_9LAMI
MCSSVEVIHGGQFNKFYSQQLDLSGNRIRDAEELPHPFCYNTSLYNGEYKYGYEIHLVGSCNGVLCFVDSDHHIVLWNITTHKYFELQRLDNEIPEFTGLPYDVNYGFGYDDALDDYKRIHGVLVEKRRPSLAGFAMGFIMR